MKRAKKIHFTVGGKKKEEPMEVVESASENAAVRRLRMLLTLTMMSFPQEH